MIWYLSWLVFIDFIFWPPKIINIWRLRPPGSSEIKRGIRMESEHQKIYDLIPHMAYFQWFHIWPPEVINIRRSRPPGSSEVIKGWMTSDLKLSSWSMWRTKIRGYMQISAYKVSNYTRPLLTCKINGIIKHSNSNATKRT